MYNRPSMTCDVYGRSLLRRIVVKLSRQRRNVLFYSGVICVVTFLGYVRYMYTVNSAQATSDYDVPCQLQDVDPWDESLTRYYSNPHKIKCPQTGPLLYVNNTGYIVYNKTLVEQNTQGPITCVYQKVTRINDKEIEYGPWLSLTIPAFINSRIFISSCIDGMNETVHRYVHRNVAFNDENDPSDDANDENEDNPSVIIIGLDSTSRSKSLRSLPRTVTYMTNVIGAYDFSGYTKVGENTLPNLIALLARVDWRDFYESKYKNEYFDSLPFFWKNRNDYASFMCEDSVDVETFNYAKPGFLSQPSNYYCRPYFMAMTKYFPVTKSSLNNLSEKCYGDKLLFEIQLDYLRDFVEKFDRRRKVALVWNNNLGHTNFSLTENADEHIFGFIHWLKTGGRLEHTVLLVVADHGFRMGGPSLSPVGRLENANPMLMMYLPPYLKDKFHGILQNNANKFITAFDVHQTLSGLLNHHVDPPSLSLSNLNAREHMAYSLLSRIPPDRTCRAAGVPFQFCSRCYKSEFVDAQSERVQIMATLATTAINDRLSKQPLCKHLSLLHVQEAQFIHPGHSSFSRLLWLTDTTASGIRSRYNIVFETTVNGGIYEVLVEHNDDKHHTYMTLLGMPMRLNDYGSQGDCVSDFSIRPYCFCTKT